MAKKNYDFDYEIEVTQTVVFKVRGFWQGYDEDIMGGKYVDIEFEVYDTISEPNNEEIEEQLNEIYMDEEPKGFKRI